MGDRSCGSGGEHDGHGGSSLRPHLRAGDRGAEIPLELACRYTPDAVTARTRGAERPPAEGVDRGGAVDDEGMDGLPVSEEQLEREAGCLMECEGEAVAAAAAVEGERRSAEAATIGRHRRPTRFSDRDERPRGP
jgi:hypothetical protein